ncbi:MAG: hypothetical protein HRU43_00170 [Simkaniaceae bacterium]|nr:hypothetical protein [Simkaniaceae bacterium]
MKTPFKILLFSTLLTSPCYTSTLLEDQLPAETMGALVDFDETMGTLPSPDETTVDETTVDEEEKNPFPQKEGGAYYTFEEFSEKMIPLLADHNGLQTDFEEGFRAIFMHGTHRASAPAETAGMNLLYWHFQRTESDSEKQAILYDCFRAPRNLSLIQKHAKALHERLGAAGVAEEN